MSASARHCSRDGSGSTTVPLLSDTTFAGAITFLAQHESYHVGQLALLRKGLGLGPMSYE